MSWNIKIPHRSPSEPLDPSTIYELTEGLDEEDRLVSRELFTRMATDGVATVGQVASGVKLLDKTDRRRLLDGLRKVVGLPTTGEVESGKRAEQATAAARAVASSAFQSCPACGQVPLTEVGSWAPVNVRQWWCEAHIDQAQPGDMDVRSSGLKITEGGAIVPIDEGEIAKQQAEAEMRRAELEASMAQRTAEAESRARYEQAIKDDVAKHVPPGVPS